MENQNREDPKRRDQPPYSIPPTGRGHSGVCVEPLRPDDGGCAMLSDTRTINVSRWTHWLSDLLLPPMLPQRLRARPHPFSSRNSTHWRSQLPRDLQMVLPLLRRACPSKSGLLSRSCPVGCHMCKLIRRPPTLSAKPSGTSTSRRWLRPPPTPRLATRVIPY